MCLRPEELIWGLTYTVFCDTIFMKTPQEHLISLLSNLVVLNDLKPRCDEVVEFFRYITAESLARYPEEHSPRLSSLTRDGLPFELAVSLNSQGSSGLHYVTEAGDLRATFRERLLQSSKVADHILELIGAEHTRSLHSSLFKILFPEEIQRLDYRFGMWYGMVHRPGLPDIMKIYYNLRPWRQDIPFILHKSFSVLSTSVNTYLLQEITKKLPESARPVSLCVEHSEGGQVKVKLYYRCVEMVQKHTLDKLLIALGLTEHQTLFNDFHRLFAGSRTDYPERSVLLYIGLDSINKVPVLSLYFVLSSYLSGDWDARCNIISLMTRMRINPYIYEHTLRTVACGPIPEQSFRYHNMISIGFAPSRTKINIYLKPTWEDLARKCILNYSEVRKSSEYP